MSFCKCSIIIIIIIIIIIYIITIITMFNRPCKREMNDDDVVRDVTLFRNADSLNAVRR